jgi:hypothetical protein
MITSHVSRYASLCLFAPQNMPVLGNASEMLAPASKALYTTHRYELANLSVDFGEEAYSAVHEDRSIPLCRMHL